MNQQTTHQTAAYQVVNNYESLSVLTGRMREAAMHGEWDRLTALEKLCSLHVESMKPADTNGTLDEQARLRKIDLIKKIMADDRDIRGRTEGWMMQLQRIMQSNRQGQLVQQTYSPGY